MKAKLAVSRPWDPYEQEADLISAQVMRTTAALAAPGATLRATAVLQRKCSASQQGEEPTLVMRACSRAVGSLGADDVAHGEGRPLPPAVQASMEATLGHSFSRIRVHTDERAAASAQALHAYAYTVGRDVAFAAGCYAPETAAGRHLLAHELVHTIQQGTAPRIQDAGGVQGGVGAALVQTAPRQVQRLGVEDCSLSFEGVIRAAAAAAVPAIHNTISRILAVPRDPNATAALTTYFGVTGPSNAALIAQYLGEIGAKLPNATVECENPGNVAYNYFCGDPNAAYVRPALALFGMGNIHVCEPKALNLNPTQTRDLIVHEAAHRYVSATGDAYYRNCKQTTRTLKMTDVQRLWNADSYACLVSALG